MFLRIAIFVAQQRMLMKNGVKIIKIMTFEEN